MSSCLSGGGRTYGFDLEIVKSSSTSTRTSQTSSPSSTLSESSNSPLVISTRKPRTARKRPNQTYNEAAALLSTVYPNIFSSKHLTRKNNNTQKFRKPHEYSFFDDSSELLLPFRAFDDSGFLLHPPIQGKPGSPMEPKVPNSGQKSCSSSGEIDSQVNSMELCDEYQDDFDAESILDEEIEGGIDSIMGNLSVNNDSANELKGIYSSDQIGQIHSWNGNPMGIGFGGKFDFGFGMRRGVSALRHVDEGNWWNFPTVDVLQISPKFNTTITAINNVRGGNNKKKVAVSVEKKKKKVEKPVVESKSLDLANENPNPNPNPNPKPNSGLLLNLNYDDVLNAWSDRESPFSDDITGPDGAGNDVSARLAQIDLFSDGGGLREASVLRYKEKRRTRLFSKKIRYEVRKANADRRPRMKGRFVRRPNSMIKDEKEKKGPCF